MNVNLLKRKRIHRCGRLCYEGIEDELEKRKKEKNGEE
jgi:hypothetical protein